MCLLEASPLFFLSHPHLIYFGMKFSRDHWQKLTRAAKGMETKNMLVSKTDFSTFFLVYLLF